MITQNVQPAVYNERTTGLATGDALMLMELQAALESRTAWEQNDAGDQASDVRFNAATQHQSLQSDASICFGRVVLSYPYTHCYRVQLSDHTGVCIASAVGRSSHSPVGVKIGEVIPPNSDVLVWRPKSSMMAYILAVLPSMIRNDQFNLSDMVQQGGNSGVKKVEAYRNAVKTETNAYGWVSQSCGRPMDGTLNEYVRMSETGIGLLIDSFQAYLRVNEACGLFLNYFDSHTKLTGLNLDILSYCAHDRQANDEGELVAIKGHATYPWEAAGLYGAGERFTVSNPAQSVQLDKQFPFAAEDVPTPDQTPVHRLTEYGGYLGQGATRMLMKPAAESGKRRLSDAASADTGLFQESLTLDGGYAIKSAKYVMLAKYPSSPSPRRKRQIEDAKGDDSTSGYRFSGMSGDGPEHIVEEWQTDESFVPNMLRPAALLDAMVRHHNWKSTHPFHYHSGDYVYPDESQNGELASVEFARGRFDRSYREIYPRKVRIDFRYKDVDYYDNASIIALLEDGSVVLTDGYGSRIFMGGGQIRLEATGDCMLSAGGRVTVMGKEVVVRGKDHVDLSASDGELRLKSERNMQLLAANSGTGGLLLESKGQGVRQDYKNKIGEEVQASGIMLLAKGGSLTTASQTAYFRTGVMEGNAEGMGDFVIDVANGRSAMTWYASFVSLFSQQGMGIWYPPVGQGDPQIEDATYFGPDYSQLNGALTVRGNATLVDGGTLAVARDIYSGGNIIATQYVAAAGGLEGIADSSQNDLPAAIQNYIRVYEEFADRVEESGRPIFEAVFTRGWWPERMPGNNDLLANQIGFSYRDKSRTGRAYGYTEDGFQFLETWWQMLGRRGLVEAGEAWTEKPVQYQGEKLYPWPGRVNWVENDRLVAYDTAAGSELFEGLAAASRTTKQTDYERPTYGRWSRQACDGNYKL